MKRDKILDYISWTALFISTLLLRVLSRFLENIIEGKRFVLYVVITGVIIASVWMYLLFRMYRDYFNGGEKRASAVLCQYFAIIVLFIYGCCFYNYFTGLKNQTTRSALVVSKSPKIVGNIPYIHLMIDGRRERFSPTRKEYKFFDQGDTISIVIGKGDLGYQFIIGFSPSR